LAFCQLLRKGIYRFLPLVGSAPLRDPRETIDAINADGGAAIRESNIDCTEVFRIPIVPINSIPDAVVPILCALKSIILKSIILLSIKSLFTFGWPAEFMDLTV
jgi:hypothetical protein